MCYCDKLTEEVCEMTNSLNCLNFEMRQLQDLYIKKNEEKEELIKMIEYKKSQLLMIDDWSKLSLEDKESIINKLSK